MRYAKKRYEEADECLHYISHEKEANEKEIYGAPAGGNDLIDSLKLSQKLNHAIFLYEIAGEKKKALRILTS